MSSQYDFDTIIDRHHTGAMKTDVLCERYGREDLIPLWIADMDFAVAPCITDALVRRLQHRFTDMPRLLRAIGNPLSIGSTTCMAGK